MGDLAAADGNWMSALTHWITTRDGPGRTEADRRIRWFLDEAAQSAGEVRFDARNRDSSLPVLLAGCGLGAFGTAIVLFGEGQTGAAQNIASLAAWICFIAAAALAVIWAWHAGRASRPLTDADIALAFDLAASLDASASRDEREPA